MLWAGQTVSTGPFTSKLITAARRTWALLCWTDVETTLPNRGVFEQIEVYNLVLLSIEPSLTLSGMACQASDRVARSWIASSGRLLRGGLRLVIRGRGNVLSFWICLCFIFLAITAIGCVGAMWKDPMLTAVFFTNILPSAPGTEWGARRHNRGFLRGGLAAAGLSPFLFLSHRSRRRSRLLAHYLGPGSLAFRWVASGRAWAAQLVAWLSLAAELQQLHSWSA